VSNLTIDEATEGAASSQGPVSDAAPQRAPAILTPYLAVAGAERALRWYAEAFGARTRGETIVMPGGRIGHAELDIGGATIMLSDEYPEIGVTAPGAGASVTLVLTVGEVDAVIARAVEAGAELARAAADYEYGRVGVIRDPFGHRWMISSPPPAARPTASTTPGVSAAGRATDATASEGLRHGDIGYVSLFVPDVERAARFFSSVLGWQYEPGSGPQGRQVQGLNIHHGLWGGQERSTLFLCFAVDDVEAAVRRVRDAGGTAGDPVQEPYGMASACVDDDGVAFAVFELPAGPPQAPPPHDATEGDLAYVTMETRSSAAARAFYGDVLGWRFTPGRVEDGWQVDDVAPMVGVASGHEVPTSVPMYRVSDIVAAVGRVRAAGGSATEPDSQPYGSTALCTDDQGTRFYLGQLS